MSQCKSLGKTDPDHERTDEPGATGESNRINICWSNPRPVERYLHRRDNVALVSAAGVFGYNTTIFSMDGLVGGYVAKYLAATNNGSGGIVTTGLNSEDGGWVIQWMDDLLVLQK